MNILNTKLKLPGHEEIPNITVAFNIYRGNIGLYEIENVSKYIKDNTVQIYILILDTIPTEDVKEIISNNDQIITLIFEQRDLVKFLVISLAKNRAEKFDSFKLNDFYREIDENNKITPKFNDWFINMKEAGYIIDITGFIGVNEQAIRFFINSSSDFKNAKNITDENISLRRLISWNAKTDISPDLSENVIRKAADALRQYGFLDVKDDKYLVKKQKTEKKILEYLNIYGGTVSISRLKRHFIFHGANEEAAFDSLIKYLQRKMLILVDGDRISFLKLNQLSEMRKAWLETLNAKKLIMENDNYLKYDEIITWKQNDWHIIYISTVHNVIKKIVEEINKAENERVIRNNTYILEELIKWYLDYCDVIVDNTPHLNNVIAEFEQNINLIEGKVTEIIDTIKEKSNVELDFNLEEFQSLNTDFSNIKSKLENNEIQIEVEKIIGPGTRPKKGTKNKIEDLLSFNKRDGNRDLAHKLILNHHMELLKPKIEPILNIIEEITQKFESIDKKEEEIISLIQIDHKVEAELSSFLIDILDSFIQNKLTQPLIAKNVNNISLSDLDAILEGKITELEYFYKEIKGLVDSYKIILNKVENIEKNINDEKLIFDLTKMLYDNINELYSCSDDIKNSLDSILEHTKKEMINIANTIDLKAFFFNCDEKLSMINIKNLYEWYIVKYTELNSLMENKINYTENFKTKVIPKLHKSNTENIEQILDRMNEQYIHFKDESNKMLTYIENTTNPPNFNLTYSQFSQYENTLKESLFKEIKDIDKEEVDVLMTLINILDVKKIDWLSFETAIEYITKSLARDYEDIKKILIKITDKGILYYVLTI